MISIITGSLFLLSAGIWLATGIVWVLRYLFGVRVEPMEKLTFEGERAKAFVKEAIAQHTKTVTSPQPTTGGK